MQSMLSKKEAALRLGISPGAIRLYISKHKLPAFKKAGVWFIHESDLKTFQESEWFRVGRHLRPGAPRKYPDDMPRLGVFAYRPRKKLVHNQELALTSNPTPDSAA